MQVSPWRQAINDDKTSTTLQRVTDGKIDLNKDWGPQLIADYDGKRLFHLFYTKLLGVPKNQEWIIQRVKKITRDFDSPTQSKPEETIEYLVEIFKAKDGAMKAEDQHHGNYKIGKFYRREILKTAEVGYGEITGLYSGAPWPLEKARRYLLVNDYSKNSNIYEKVKFTEFVTYNFKVLFEKNGHFLFDSPDLSLRANEK